MHEVTPQLVSCTQNLILVIPSYHVIPYKWSDLSICVELFADMLWMQVDYTGQIARQHGSKVLALPREPARSGHRTVPGLGLLFEKLAPFMLFVQKTAHSFALLVVKSVHFGQQAEQVPSVVLCN